MKTWADINRARDPSVTARWQRPYEFTRPVLLFNAAVELWGALGMFLLARHWAMRWRRNVIGEQAPPAPPAWRADLTALLAAGMLWFNPAMILSAHCWPTWDAWVPDFFIWALLLANWNRFFWCGFVVAIGACFKGQQWIVAPMFVLYPLMQLRVLPGVRWVIGAATGVALMTGVWAVRVPIDAELLREAVHKGRQLSGQGEWVSDPTLIRRAEEAVWNSEALTVVGAVTLAGLITLLEPVWRRYLRKVKPWPLMMVQAGLVGVVLWGFAQRPGGGLVVLVGLLVLAGVLGVQWRVNFSWKLTLAAGLFALSVLACYPLYGASTAWMEIGWKYGTYHWPWMIMGLTSNFPGILSRSYGYDNQTALGTVALTTWGVAVTFRTLFKTIFGIGLVLSSFAAARHERNNDPKFLLAAVAPWVLMFAILGQIHERYLLFAAAVSCCLVVVSWGWGLMCAFWTFVTFIMTLHVMLSNPDARELFGKPPYLLTRETARHWLMLIGPTFPAIGWAVCLSAVVTLVAALTWTRRRKATVATAGAAERVASGA
jgi:hypothetical protein